MSFILKRDCLSDVSIIFPPHWCTSHPYLSLPCLQSYLMSEKIPTNVIDLNVEIFDYFISSEFFTNLINEYTSKFNNREICILKKINEEIEQCKNGFKDVNKFQNGRIYSENKRILDLAYRYISIAGGFEINRNRLKYFDKISIENINAIMEKSDEDLIYKAYERLINIEKFNKTKLIAISLVSEDQLIPTLLLCRYLRTKLESIHIVIGGSYLTKLIHDDFLIKYIFKYCDSIIIDEGEKALLDLAKFIIGMEKQVYSKNIIFKHNYEAIISETCKTEYCEIENLPIPSFLNLLNDKYLSPVRILPYYVSRKCYWNKCSFCQHDDGYNNRVKVKSINKIRQELIVYKKEYKADVIHFIDSAMHPNTIRNICRIIKEEKLDIKWYCYIRAEKSFDIELLKEMKACGCIHVNIGIESFCNTVLESMNKGIKKDDITNIIMNTDNAGIWAHIFLINNFPTETKSDKYESILYLNKMKKHIHSISIGEFLLMRNTDILANPKRYNISQVYKHNTFSSHYEYEKIVGDNYDDTNDVTPLIYDLVPTSKLFNEKLVYRDHLPALLSCKELVLEKHSIMNFIDEVGDKDIKYKVNKYIELEKNDKYVHIFITKILKSFKIPIYFFNILNNYIDNTICEEQFINNCLYYKIDENVGRMCWKSIIENKVIYKCID